MYSDRIVESEVSNVDETLVPSAVYQPLPTE